MATRHAREARLRLSGEAARAHISDARKLLGQLAEQLQYQKLKVGRLNRTLLDGTTISAWYDGTLMIAEIISPADKKQPCTEEIIDLFGLAFTPHDPDEYPFQTEPGPADLPTARNIGIVGWRTGFAPSDAVLDALTEERIRDYWHSQGKRPEAAAARNYDKVADACGKIRGLHGDLTLGNWDWTNGRDTLTCWAGQPVILYEEDGRTPKAVYYRQTKRYGVFAAGPKVFLRGRELYDITAYQTSASVTGMALRRTNEGTFLIVAWHINNSVLSGLIRVPLTWSKTDEFPELGNPESIISFSSTNHEMWCFNSSGTEARKIGQENLFPNVGIKEFVLTDSGITYQSTTAEDTYATPGSGTKRDAWLIATPEFYGYPGYGAPGWTASTPYPAIMASMFDTMPPSAPNALGVWKNYGYTRTATGTGQLKEKRAVDYIGDVPEYLYEVVSGGSTNEVYSPTTDISTHSYSESAGPPLVRTQTSQLTSSFTSSTNNVEARVSYEFSTYGEFVYGTATQVGSGSGSAVIDTYDETYNDDPGPYYVIANNKIHAERISSNTTTQRRCTVYYVDLRYGLAVYSVVTSTTTSSASLTEDVGYEWWASQNSASATYGYPDNSRVDVGSSVTSIGAGVLYVSLAGNIAYEHEFTEPGSSTSVNTTTDIVDFALADSEAVYDPDPFVYDVRKNSQRRRYIRAAIISIWIQASFAQRDGPSVPPDSTTWTSAWDWFANSIYATPHDAAYVSGPPGEITSAPLSFRYPASNSLLVPFTTTVLYQPDDWSLDPEDWTYDEMMPLVVQQFSAVVTREETDDEPVHTLYLSMPLPMNGTGQPWTVLNIFPSWFYEKTTLPDTYRFYPMALISPSFTV